MSMSRVPRTKLLRSLLWYDDRFNRHVGAIDLRTRLQSVTAATR